MSVFKVECTNKIATIAPTEALHAFNASSLRKQCDTLLASGVQTFIIDLSKTPSIDSAGMAVLVSLLKRSRQQGGNVKLVRSQAAAVQRMFRLTQFDQVFEMLDAGVYS